MHAALDTTFKAVVFSNKFTPFEESILHLVIPVIKALIK